MSRTLVVLSGGHPFDAAPFDEMLAALAGWAVSHIAHPDAENLVAEGALDDADAVLFYDMPGYEFAEGGVTTTPPSPGFMAAVERRFAAGRGAVLMHHALAGWARWPQWADLAGGRFLYQGDQVRGKACLDSGYRHDVDYEAEIIADHPVTAGLPARFPVRDELYLAQIFEESVEPLVRARHDFVAENFYSAANAVAGRMFDNQNWPHPPGSNLIAWAHHYRSARIVYVQCGDGPDSYANPHVRRLLGNALDWTAETAISGDRI